MGHVGWEEGCDGWICGEGCRGLMGMTGREWLWYHMYSLWPYLLGMGEAPERRYSREVKKVAIWGRRLAGRVGMVLYSGCCSLVGGCVDIYIS